MSSQVFAPYRVLGLIAGEVPFVVERRGTENFLTVACDRTFQLVHCAKLHLVFAGGEHPHRITAIAQHGDTAITASGNPAELRLWQRGKQLASTSENPLHTGRVETMLVLGQTLLTIGRGAGRTLRMWDLSVPGAITPLEHQLPAFDSSLSVTCMLHPHTYLNKVVLGGEGGTLQLWNLHSRHLVHSFAGLDAAGADVICLAQSPVVDVIAVGLASGAVVLHNLRADVTLFRVTHAGGATTAIAFRTDGIAVPVMATGNSRGGIALWHLDRRELLGELPDAHDAAITSLAFLEGEPVLISAANDNSIKMWIFDNAADPGAARLLRMRAGHAKPPMHIAYYGGTDDVGGGRLLLSSAQDRSLRLFSAVRDQQCIEFSQGKGIIKKAHKVHRETERLKLPAIADFAAWPLRAREWDNVVTCHAGLCIARTWSFHRKAIGTHELASTEQPTATPFVRVALSLCGNFAVLGACSGWIEKFNIQSGQSRGAFVGHTAEITGLGTDGLNRMLISTSLDGTLRFWDFDTRKQLDLVELGVPATHMRINRDNNLVAVVTDDARIRVYDATTRALARRFDGHAGHITDIAFSEDGRWLVSAGVDRTIRTWDLPTGRMIDWFATKRAATAVALSPVGDFLATAHVGKLGISLWVNKMFFMTVLLHPPPPLPETAALPTISSPQPAIEEEDDEKDDGEEDEVPEQGEGLVTLSMLPTAKWQTIDVLDQIRERNKPKTAKAPEIEVPFFMPTVPGLAPKFAIDTDSTSKKKDGEVGAGEETAGSRVLAMGGSSAKTPFLTLLEAAGESGDFSAAMEHIMGLGPSAVDFELRMLPTDTPAMLLLVVRMLTSELEKRRNFEVLQVLLRLFLQLHSDSLLRHGAELAEATRKLLATQRSVWHNLEGLLHSNFCLINYTLGIQT